MTPAAAVCTAGTVPDEQCQQQPRLTNSALMNATPQVRRRHAPADV